MKSFLVLSEKNKEAKKLVTLLVGNNFTTKRFHYEATYNNQKLYVAYSDGHLFSAKEPHEVDSRFKSWSLDHLPMPPLTMGPESYKPMEGRKEAIISNLHALKSEVDEMVIATDKDDQGQFIGDLIVSKIKFTKPVKRWRPSVLTEKQVKKDFDDVGALPDNKKYANTGHSEMIRNLCDAYMGFNLTRLYTLLMRKTNFTSKAVLAVGRIQTSCLGILARRHEERLNFKSHSKHRIELKIKSNGQAVVFESKTEYPNKEAADKKIDTLAGPATIINKSTSTHVTEPPAPLYLSSMQEYIGRHYKYSSEEVKAATEKNYDEGYMTYPRTDSSKIEYKFWQQAKSLLSDFVKGSGISEDDLNYSAKSKNILSESSPEPAHAALIPTDKKWDLSKSGVRWEVYKAASLFFAAQFMQNKETLNSVIEASVNGEVFIIKGRQTTQEGWSKYLPSNTKDEVLPELEEGQVFEDRRISPRLIKAKKPGLYKDYELIVILDRVGEMLSADNEDLAKFFIRTDKKGIGSPATRSEGVNNLLKHQLVGIVSDGDTKCLDVTEEGYCFYKALRSDFTRPDVFARWERYFFMVGSGDYDPEAVLNKIIKSLKKIIIETKADPKTHFNYINNKKVITGYPCPKCQTDLVKNTRFNKWNCQSCEYAADDYEGEPCDDMDGDGDACNKDGCDGILKTAAGISKDKKRPWKALRCTKCRKFK